VATLRAAEVVWVYRHDDGRTSVTVLVDRRDRHVFTVPPGRFDDSTLDALLRVAATFPPSVKPRAY
jgi:hypothetical protein